MSNEVYAFALKTTLDEIQNACPDVSNTFIFKDGKILAKSETTDEKTANHTINAFNSITERADAIGGVEAVSIQGTNGKVEIACINDFYLTTVTSKKADEKYVNTLTRVLIPIIIKLVDKVHATSPSVETPTVELEEEAANNHENKDTKDYENKPDEKETATPEEQRPSEEQEKSEVDNEPLLPEPPVTQLIVENLTGLLFSSDTVRIDKTVITEWNELYGNKKIEEINIETLDGKTARCKFKPIKDSKQEGKGIIQIPAKLQITLETAKGELVTVKPVIK